VDKVRSTFDNWALSGRSDLMEKEHAKTVFACSFSIKSERPFTAQLSKVDLTLSTFN